MSVVTSRKSHMAERVVFVDGQAGCGKSMFSRIIASLERVELLTYSYEIEYFCALQFLGKLSSDATQTLIRLKSDLQLYNLMMGREANFRPSDLSSVFSDHNPTRYFQRLMLPGDEAIPENVRRERPILNLATHQLLPFSEPIWQSLGNRCVFVEVVRHPLYMVRQQELNMVRLPGDVRDFLLNIEYKGHEFPFYAHGWEYLLVDASPMEQTIHSIDQLTGRTEKMKRQMKEKYDALILTVPFEPFVLDPEPWLTKIADALETNIVDSTRKVMLDQNVPRDKIAQGIDSEIYRRCGWTPPREDTDEREELKVRREDAARTTSKEVLVILDRLCDEYEKKYWSPEF